MINKIIKYILTLFLLLTIRSAAQTEWREDSFGDFIDGKFLDAGSNAYVSAKGRIQMITRWDFNNDGNLDIFIPSSQSHTEKENIFLYLNKGDDFDGRSRIELPAAGAIDGLLEDFNKDGFDDLAVIHYSDSYFKRVPVWIYLGSAEGYSIDNRVELPSAGGSAIVKGDFNNDSWQDVAIACQYWENSEDTKVEPRKSFIYWNSQNGFDPENNLTISINKKGFSKLASGDLDNDSIDDLIGMTADKTYLLLSSRDAFNNIDNKVTLDIKATAASVGDMNNDGIADMALCRGDRVVVYKTVFNGAINLKDAVGLKVGNASDVEFKDVNNDKLDDIIIADFATKGGANWTDSPVYFSNGNGFNVQPVGLPTLGAKDVTCTDLNGDGYPELIFSFFQLVNQKNLLSYIYWNDKGTFRFGNHTQLPTLGTMANAVGDVNNDGLPDVVFFNDEGYFRDGAQLSPLYWGDGTRNFDPRRKHVFRTQQVFGFGHADLDDDNNVDMILCQKNFVSGVKHDQGGLIIHWGNGHDFDAPSHLTMKWGYGGVRVADINRDGFLDMVAGGYCIDLNEPDKHGFPVFWGSPGGYSYKNRLVLHYDGPRFRVPLLMDLNKDNMLDLAGQVEDGKVRIWWGGEDYFNDERITDIDLGRNDHLMYIKGADLNKDGWLDLLLPQRLAPYGTKPGSLIYYGSPEGFSNDNRTEVYSFVPYQNSIADLNYDGWLDLFLTSYGCEVDGNRPSVIHWGSENGFKKEYTEIPSTGSSGSQVLDYDGDGLLDILICNHRNADSYLLPKPHVHETPSFVYWGSNNGYSANNRLELPATGPSGLNPRDAGNSYDRGLYEDYVSSVSEVPDGKRPVSIDWEADTPFGTAVKFQIRAAGDIDLINESAWYGTEGMDSWFSKPGGTKLPAGRYIQYRARLITPNGAGTPYLTSVTISFE